MTTQITCHQNNVDIRRNKILGSIIINHHQIMIQSKTGKKEERSMPHQMVLSKLSRLWHQYYLLREWYERESDEQIGSLQCIPWRLK